MHNDFYFNKKEAFTKVSLFSWSELAALPCTDTDMRLLRRFEEKNKLAAVSSPAGGQKTNPGTEHLRLHMLSWLA